MDIINWIEKKYPGKIVKNAKQIEIHHKSGDCSTLLFKNVNQKSHFPLEKLGMIYKEFDGMDLFSSTFKIASLCNANDLQSAELIPSIQELEEDLKFLKAVFPEKVIPFMIQAGIGFYAVGINTGQIYEWDMEENKLSNKFISLEDIFEEWLDAISV